MIDLVLLVVIGGSILLGLVRGLVGTLVSTAAWLLAGWISFQFGGELAVWLSDTGTPTLGERLAGHALAFVVVMVAVLLVGALLRTLVHSVGLSGADRLLGGALGLLRGAFLACLLVLLLGFTPLADEPDWRNATVVPMLAPGADWMRARLPHVAPPASDLLKRAPAGDNGGNETMSPLLDQAVRHAIDTAGRRVSPGAEGRDPPGTDPVNLEAGGQDPANIEPRAPTPTGREPGATQRQPGRQRPTQN